MAPVTRSKRRGEETEAASPAAAPPRRTRSEAANQPRAEPATRSKADTTRSKTTPGGSQAQVQPPFGAPRTLRINRAPVLALWTAVVAEREGYSFEEGLTFGKWVSGTLAQSKGRSLGIYEPGELSLEEREARRRRDEAAGVERVEAFGMRIPCIRMGDGAWHAASQGRAVDPASEARYLERAFGAEGLAAARSAMEHLSGSIPEREIGRKAYKLYAEFRPAWHGWGQKGDLDLEAIRQLAGSWREA